MKNSILSKLILAMLFIALQAINTLAFAQNNRHFPNTAVRGKIAFKSPPQIEVDGKPEYLAAGARIRDERNMLAMTGFLMGKEFVVNFKREPSTGQVHEVWILSADEQKLKRDGEKK